MNHVDLTANTIRLIALESKQGFECLLVNTQTETEFRFSTNSNLLSHLCKQMLELDRDISSEISKQLELTGCSEDCWPMELVFVKTLLAWE